ncbi:unnamed protein product, partial [Gulo gulo]
MFRLFLTPEFRLTKSQLLLDLCGGRVQGAKCCSGPGTVGGFSSPRNRVRGDPHSYGSENISLRSHLSPVPPICAASHSFLPFE